MKKHTVLFFALVVVLLMLPLVSAAVTVSNVALSLDDAVERSNPIPEGSDNDLDDTDELSYVTFSIPVAATGQAETVTSVTPNLNGFSYDTFADEVDSSDRYIIDTALPLTVAAGTTQNVVVRVLVPSNLDAIDSSYNRVQHTLTASVVTSAGTQTPTLSFYVENGLELKKVRVVQGSDSHKCSVEDGDTSLDCDDEVEELQRGQNFDLEFTVENIFNDDSELDLEGVEVELDSDNSDVDANDDSFDEDIDTDSEQPITVTFDVDEDIDDGDDSTITIQASVEDENGARHGFEYDLDVSFDTKDYEIATPILSVNPNAVCAGYNVVFTYELENLGSRDQSNVRPVLISDALGLNKVLATVSLDSEGDNDDSYKGTSSYAVPSSAKPGSYPIQLQVYYRDEDDSDALQTNSATLTVQNCVNGQPVQTTGSNSGSSQNGGSSGSSGSNTGSQTTGGVVVVQPGQTGSTANSGSTTATTGGSSVPVRAVVADNSDTPYLIGLGVALLVLLVVVGLLIAAIVRK